ncbi:MAG: hypothetical protein ABSB73_11895 [Solirubrobacteraceae bacterium]
MGRAGTAQPAWLLSDRQRQILLALSCGAASQCEVARVIGEPAAHIRCELHALRQHQLVDTAFGDHPLVWTLTITGWARIARGRRPA